eukprot:CAMPEP_0201492320 /NCGR_PEP_ID=MMETSP0151_2-20130828/32635_1 /ASSEMBLY_ACC=CAM_ASM_000257 /TAXON_ID=200890 /ORGANISM="Paramoeba atlantica, Strain 621/1 / CCAP 1560/9" /LENGTH=223 /DNA_ID=CAMNT_0047879061 /DNA_START=166 /DNA_END=837 /DNA_ORIENTATION=-
MPLQNPIVVCPLGRLYNKDIVIELLLEKKTKELPEVSHIRAIKDVFPVSFTPNPQHEPENSHSYPFICPVSCEVFNGIHSFVYLRPCSHVISEKYFDMVGEKDALTCPVCEKPFSSNELIPLCRDEEVVQGLREKMEKERAEAKQQQGSKKRKKREAKEGTKSKKPKVDRPRPTATTTTTQGGGGGDSTKSAVYKSLFLEKEGKKPLYATTFTSTAQKSALGL